MNADSPFPKIEHGNPSSFIFLLEDWNECRSGDVTAAANKEFCCLCIVVPTEPYWEAAATNSAAGSPPTPAPPTTPSSPTTLNLCRLAIGQPAALLWNIMHTVMTSLVNKKYSTFKYCPNSVLIKWFVYIVMKNTFYWTIFTQLLYSLPENQ